jgi:hypothetical protein
MSHTVKKPQLSLLKNDNFKDDSAGVNPRFRLSFTLFQLLVFGITMKSYGKESCSELFAQIKIRRTNSGGLSPQALAFGDAWSKVSAATKKYFQEIKDSHGLRLLVKESNEGPAKLLKPYESPTGFWGRWGGRINLPQLAVRGSTKILKGTQHSLHPFDFLYDKSFNAPIRVVQKIFHAQKKVVPTLPAVVGVGYFVDPYVREAAKWTSDKIRFANILSKIEKDKEAWNEKIAFQILYADIYQLLKEKILTPEQARVAAYIRQQGSQETRHHSLAVIYGYFEKKYDYATPKERMATLLSHPMFSDVMDIASGKITTEGFSGSLDRFTQNPEKVVAEIIDAKRLYFTKLQIIETLRDQKQSTWIQEPAVQKLYQYTEINEETGKEEQKIDPYFLAIKRRLENKEITEQVALFMLEEDLDWQYEFEKRDLLGQQFLRVDEKGAYTTVPLELVDIRKESMSERAQVLERGKIFDAKGAN